MAVDKSDFTIRAVPICHLRSIFKFHTELRFAIIRHLHKDKGIKVVRSFGLAILEL